MLFDKITDNIFRAKEILEANLKYKQSITSGIIKSIAMSQTYIKRANEEIKQTDYFNQIINCDYDFLKEDPQFIIINDFYQKAYTILDDVRQKYIFFCKKQLDI